MESIEVRETIAALVLIIVLMVGLTSAGVLNGIVSDPILSEVVNLVAALVITFVIFVAYARFRE
jgi:hypothetical protein